MQSVCEISYQILPFLPPPWISYECQDSRWLWAVDTFHLVMLNRFVANINDLSIDLEKMRGCWTLRVVCAMVIAKSKKVKPHMNTIKSMDYTWTPGPEPPSNQEHGVPRAIFTPYANSLPFEERNVTLEQPVKVNIINFFLILFSLGLLVLH